MEYHPLKAITSSTFIDNKADFGAALYSSNTLPQSFVSTCYFSANQAFKFGPNLLAAAKFTDIRAVLKVVKPGETFFVNVTALSLDSETIPLNSMPNFIQQNYFGKRIYLNIVQETLLLFL